MLSKTTVDALRAQGWSYRAIAAELGSNYSAVYRLARATPTNGARTDATISNHVIVQSRTPDELATDVEAMKQQLTVLTSFMAAMQARNGACTAHALHGAEQNLGQRFPEAADRQPERWNLYVPKGLRRLIETQAQALGIAPSKRVVSLLLSALTAEGSDG